MDKDTINISEDHEIRTVIKSMKKEGIFVKRSQVLDAIEQIGNNRDEVYEYLRKKI